MFGDSKHDTKEPYRRNNEIRVLSVRLRACGEIRVIAGKDRAETIQLRSLRERRMTFRMCGLDVDVVELDRVGCKIFDIFGRIFFNVIDIC